MIWFIPYLILILLGELSANNYWVVPKGANNGWFYVLINAISFYFYSFVLYNLTANKQFKKVIIAAGVVFMVFMAAVWTQPDWGLKFNIIYTSVALSSFACMYFYSTMQDDETEGGQSYISGLWITSGILIFYLGIIICFSLLGYIRDNHLSMGGLSLSKLIPQCLSTILYSCFCISFALWKAPTKSLSSQS